MLCSLVIIVTLWKCVSMRLLFSRQAVEVQYRSVRIWLPTEVYYSEKAMPERGGLDGKST